MLGRLLESVRDWSLRTGLIRKDPSSVEALFEEHAGRLFGYANSISLNRQDAEEAVQSVFLRLARNPASLEKVGNLKAYLYRAVRNESLNQVKRGRREVPAGERILEMADGKESDLETVELDDALRSLPPAQREAVVLKYYQGLSFREMAELLEIPLDTAASRCRYALESLRKTMGVSRNG